LVRLDAFERLDVCEKNVYKFARSVRRSRPRDERLTRVTMTGEYRAIFQT